MEKVILLGVKNYSDCNYTFRLSDDRESTIYSANTTFFVDVLRMQERFNVTLKKDPLDEKYSVHFLTTTINPCMFGSGRRPTILQRVLMATFEQSSDTKMHCPFPKNKVLTISNLTFTDALLPPMNVEKHFKVHTRLYGVIKDKKGWTFMADNTWYGSNKK